MLSNKVLKNVFVAEMEDVIDKDLKITHSSFSSKVWCCILEVHCG